MEKSTARKIAATIITRCQARRMEVSNLKLQKLLYYTQAWHLVFEDGPLFDDALEAWVHGPVVPKVFGDYKSFRWAPVTDPCIPPENDSEICNYIDIVLNAYGPLSATDLERLTHSELPWLEARAGLAPDEPSRNRISTETMKAYYSRIAAS